MKRTLILLLELTALLVRHQMCCSAEERLHMMIWPPRASVKQVRNGAVTRGTRHVNTRWSRAAPPAPECRFGSERAANKGGSLHRTN